MEAIDRSPRDRVISLTKGEFSSSSSSFGGWVGGWGSSLGVWGFGEWGGKGSGNMRGWVGRGEEGVVISGAADLRLAIFCPPSTMS